MSWLSSIVRKAAEPVAKIASVAGIASPKAAAVAAVAREIQKKNIKREIRDQRIERDKTMEREIFSSQQPAIRNSAFVSPKVNANMGVGNGGGFFQGVSDFFTSTGSLVRDAFGSGIPQLLGLNRPQGIAQQPAITVTTGAGAQETQGSGSIQAGAGLLPNIIGGARQLLKSPFGQVALGGAAGLAGSLIGSDGRKMRVTRKMKAQARNLLNMTGGNIPATADFLNISEDALIAILLKRFRNDGPMVTKAAVRKTRSTIRKLHSMSALLNEVSRKSPVRRRKPTFSSRGTLTKSV